MYRSGLQLTLKWFRWGSAWISPFGLEASCERGATIWCLWNVCVQRSCSSSDAVYRPFNSIRVWHWASFVCTNAGESLTDCVEFFPYFWTTEPSVSSQVEHSASVSVKIKIKGPWYHLISWCCYNNQPVVDYSCNSMHFKQIEVLQELSPKNTAFFIWSWSSGFSWLREQLKVKHLILPPHPHHVIALDKSVFSDM